MHCSRQQSLIAKWLEPGVRVRATAREWDFSLFFFFFFFFFLSVLKMTNTFVLHVNGSYDVHGVRTTAAHDVTMM